tara:strand:- start:84 stop:296 length:213 start_codon:yes stop_codon:yes gene_type:complete
MLLLLLDCLKLTSSLAEADGPAQAAAGAFVMKLQAGGQVLTSALLAHTQELAQLCMHTPRLASGCKAEQA